MKEYFEKENADPHASVATLKTEYEKLSNAEREILKVKARQETADRRKIAGETLASETAGEALELSYKQLKNLRPKQLAQTFGKACSHDTWALSGLGLGCFNSPLDE
eukprot:11539823-Karenia_brevis.AAC.1